MPRAHATVCLLERIIKAAKNYAARLVEWPVLGDPKNENCILLGPKSVEGVGLDRSVQELYDWSTC